MLFRRLLCMLFALMAAPALQAHPEKEDSSVSVQEKKITLTPFNPNIYVAESLHYYKENSIVYIGANEITVIGAGWSPEAAKELAVEIHKVSTKPIRTVINTHNHVDRTGGNAYWKSIGANIVSTQQTHDIMKNDWHEIVTSTQKSFPDYPTPPLVLPNKTYPGNFELENGKIRAFYLGGSHTKDGIFIYFPEDKVLYGECIIKEKLGNLDSADIHEYIKTIEKLKDLHLDIHTVIAGHWSPIHGPELVDHYLSLLKEYSANKS